MNHCNELISRFGGDPLGKPSNERGAVITAGSLGQQLLAMLKVKNGFFAFESALHVFPVNQPIDDEVELVEWNSPSVWKDAFSKDLTHTFCFAENLFGEQFCIVEKSICRFDPETTELVPLADSIEDWACLMIAERDKQIGFRLGHEWQRLNKPLARGRRLLPRIPFVLGGAFAVENLFDCDAVEGMRFRANIANQILDLPDGSTIEFKPMRNSGNP